MQEVNDVVVAIEGLPYPQGNASALNTGSNVFAVAETPDNSRCVVRCFAVTGLSGLISFYQGGGL